MKEYSPKRRTALVFSGSGTTGAYHAGVLKALDESGVKIDLVVGSGVGAVAAAFAAVGGRRQALRSRRLLGRRPEPTFYRLRPALVFGASLLGVSFAVFLLPLVLALLARRALPDRADRRSSWCRAGPRESSPPCGSAPRR